MIYSFTLSQVALAVGALWLLRHLPAALAPGAAGRALLRFPRSRAMGVLLLGLATVWGLWLAATVDLGDFTPMRGPIIWIALLLGVGMTAYSREFPAVRGLALLLLLAANIVFDACFLRDEKLKLVLVVFAYAWVVAGLYLLFSPYLLRDAIDHLAARPARLRLGGWLGAGFGLALILLGLFAY